MQLTIVTGNACLGNNGLSDLRGQVIASSWKCLEGLLSAMRLTYSEWCTGGSNGWMGTKRSYHGSQVCSYRLKLQKKNKFLFFYFYFSWEKKKDSIYLKMQSTESIKQTMGKLNYDWRTTLSSFSFHSNSRCSREPGPLSVGRRPRLHPRQLHL